MLQFYFLSVLLNALTGIVLVCATDFLSTSASSPGTAPEDDDFLFGSEEGAAPEERRGPEAGGSFLDDMTFRLALGILTAFMGFMKLFVSFGGSCPVLGDLLPALAGIAGGAVLLVEHLAVGRDDILLPDALERFCTAGRRIVGCVCIGAAVLHFIVPRLLLV